MAEAPLGYMSWPGVGQVLSGSFTLCQGVSPSVCTLEIIPQATGVTIEGTLAIVCGAVILLFPGCRVDQSSFSYGPDGLLWRLSIWDRRWRWRFGTISGSANERHDDVPAFGAPFLQPPQVNPVTGLPIPPPQGLPPIPIGTIDTWTEATPQDMASDLLNAMGVQVYDVSQMPNYTRPEAYYNHDNPAQSLAHLAESVGCRVALGADDVVRVVRTGFGAALPSGPVLRTSDVTTPPVIPESVMVVGGKTRYQVDLLLEAVGQDIDGTIKPIDKLSYKPAVGWNTADAYGADAWHWNVPGFEQQAFPLVPPNAFALGLLGVFNARERAQQCIFHWYRPSMVGIDNPNKGVDIGGPAGPPVRAVFLWQILPLEDVQILGYFDESRKFQPYPAIVAGQYCYLTPHVVGAIPKNVDPATGNSPPGSQYFRDFTIDKERGIVIFPESVFLAKPAPGQPAPAVLPYPAPLYLRCTVHYQDPKTGAFDHYELSRNLPGGSPGSGPMVIRRDEIVLNVLPVYDAHWKIIQAKTNKADCDKEANYAIDAAVLEFQLQDSGDATYGGILPVNPDGAIWQVTWAVGPGGATTRVARNSEWDPKVPTYRERRMLESAGKNDKAINALIGQSRRERG